MKKDADVRERILLVTRVRTDKEEASSVAEKEFHRSIPVNKSSLTTIDIFQLKILANRQRINVNWYRWWMGLQMAQEI